MGRKEYWGAEDKMNIFVDNMMSSEITWGVDTSKNKEGRTNITQLQLDRIKKKKYRNPKITNLKSLSRTMK